MIQYPHQVAVRVCSSTRAAIPAVAPLEVGLMRLCAT